jgi:hypothetical protein
MSLSPVYKHTQFGKTVVVSLVLTGLLLVALGVALGDRVFMIGGPLMIALALLLFHSLTIEVDADHLVFRFGIGLIRKRIPLVEIVDAKPVRNTWIHGWGIHFTADGWVYNVSGWEAVEITLANGKRLRLGTDQPNQLARKLRPTVDGLTKPTLS